MKYLFVIFASLVLLASAACTGVPTSESTTAPTVLPTLPGATAAPAATITSTSLPTVAASAVPTAAPTAAPTIAPTTGSTGVPNVPPQPVASSTPVMQVTGVPTTEGLEAEAYAIKLIQAIERKDFDVLRTLMGSRFSFVTQNKSLYDNPAQEALNDLAKYYLSDGAQPAGRMGTDTFALMNGKDPLAEWGPVANVIRVVHVMGLGPLADSEALIAIGRDNVTGKYNWHGILTPENGTNFTNVQPVGDALPTNVKLVEALDAVRMRSGPGFNYAVEGLMRQGEFGQVTGVSADGQWWQVLCTMDASGHCWVTSDPSLIAPR